MSSDMVDLASSPTSPEEAPGIMQDVYKNLDTEITTPLTLDDSVTTSSSTSHRSQVMNPFQTAKDRFGRLNGYGNGNGNGATPSAAVNTTTTQSNPTVDALWRREASALISSTSSPSNHSRSSLTNSVNRQRSRSLFTCTETVPISMVKPGPVWPSENQLKFSYSYGIRRENGTYTRLIPADELDHAHNSQIPVTQGPEGLIILPPPQLAPPAKRENSGKEEMVPASVVKSLPINQPRRPSIRGRRPDPNDETQIQIDTIVASATTTPPAGRRIKVYCDKWIHEGVCAFTQLGCKYKHEMPMDKATQMALGLNHGLPAWYKRAQGVQHRPEPTTPLGTRASGGSAWRKSDATPTSAGSSTDIAIAGGGASLQGSPVGRFSFGPSSFGPIGPPSRQQFKSENPYSMLDTDMKTEHSDSEGEITYSGRKR